MNKPITTEEVMVQILRSSLSFYRKIAALILITFGIIVTSSNKGYTQTAKAETTKNIANLGIPGVEPS